MCALVTGVQTCALPICALPSGLITPPGLYTAGHERHDRPVDHPCHHRSDGGRRLCRPSLGDARLSLVASQEPPRATPRPVREKRLVRRDVRHTLDPLLPRGRAAWLGRCLDMGGRRHRGLWRDLFRFPRRDRPPADQPPPCAAFALYAPHRPGAPAPSCRSEEHTSELQSLMRISYAVFCLKKKKNNKEN